MGEEDLCVLVRNLAQIRLVELRLELPEPVAGALKRLVRVVDREENPVDANFGEAHDEGIVAEVAAGGDPVETASLA